MSDDRPPMQDLDAVLRKAVHLPSLPSVALRVLELGEDPHVSLSEIASTVASDPALCLRLLKAANSPIYAARRQVDNLRQAVNILGMETAITLALSFSLKPEPNENCVDKCNYWRRSVAAAIVAQVLAEQVHQVDSGRYFLAALLQDVGMLVLEQTDPGRYASMLRSSASHAALVQAEEQAFGFNHAQLACFIHDVYRRVAIRAHLAPW